LNLPAEIADPALAGGEPGCNVHGDLHPQDFTDENSSLYEIEKQTIIQALEKTGVQPIEGRFSS